MAFGGEDYAFLCCLSYKHSIAAHKLITGKISLPVIFVQPVNLTPGIRISSHVMGRKIKQETKGMIAAYDDLLSINYFGEWRKAYWTERYTDILESE